MRKHRLSLIAAFSILPALPACMSAVPSPASAVPIFRLPGGARPTSYSITLSIAPYKTEFSGEAEIAVDLAKPTRRLWLNGTELSITRADATFAGRKVRVRPSVANQDFLSFTFDRAVGPGPLKLSVAYKGAIREKEAQGVFRQKDGDSWYVFTQFETSDARRAFPCFDEPAFKAPWQLTLRVPADHLAVSNTSVSAESADADGMKTVRFRRTEPLPSYLIAFGVGPFELVDAGTAGRKKTPIRIVVLKGKTGRAKYAAEMTGPLLERLENYFSMSFPFEKLDVLIIPQATSFGAMENAGLITFLERFALASPREQTVAFERFFADNQGHEIAHQWFGDLVTPAWWDDVWLNESFADWLSRKILNEWKPEWEVDVTRVNSRSGALLSDALPTSYKVRQPVKDKDGLTNAFSAQTYSKGAALLTMFEAWIGPEKFRSAIRRYLASHEWGSATSNDFLRAIETESGPIAAKAFATFLDQPGAPMVTATLACEGDSGRIDLAQSRLRPIGAVGSSREVWDVPVCVRFGTGGNADRACSLLTDASGTIPLRACPEWLVANEGSVGYYRAHYGGDLLQRLVAADSRLTLAELNGLLRDAAALVESGVLPIAKSFELAQKFANHPSWHVAVATARLATVAKPIVPDALRPAYARFVSRTYAARARALGFVPKPSDDDGTRLMRKFLVPVAACDGDDSVLQAQARDLAARWLDDRNAVDADLLDDVLVVAAEKGDRDLFARFREAARRSPERRDRERLLFALGSFRDPSILQTALSLFLTDDFDPIEAANILDGAAGQSTNHDALWEFVKKNFASIVARTPQEVRGFLPYHAAGFCKPGDREEVSAFYTERVRSLEGGSHNLASVLERIGMCVGLQKSQGDSLRAFLERS